MVALKFKISFRRLPGEIEETDKKPQVSLCSGQDYNRRPYEYNRETLPLEPS
jgi:hypothetical protein